MPTDEKMIELHNIIRSSKNIRNQILALFDFNIFMYIWSKWSGMKNEQNLAVLHDRFYGRNVFCIGSGPSLDKINLKEIENSVVILLNDAYRVAPAFNANNELYWLAVHTSKVCGIERYIDPKIMRIIIPNSFSNFVCIRRAIRSCDIYLHPKLSFRPNLLTPCQIKLNNKTLPDDLINFVQFPISVMLNAIYISIISGASKVICLGFDAPSKLDKSPYSYAKNCEGVNQNNGFDKGELEGHLLNLMCFADSMRSSVFNWSPDTCIDVLPKIQSVNEL